MPAAPPIQVDSENLTVHFDRFDLAAYDLFLKLKRLPEQRLIFHEEPATYTVTAPARFAPLLGLPPPPAEVLDLPFSTFLFDDQLAITRMALEARRFACWSDCGLGKSLIELEFARHVCHRTGGRALIVTLNEIVPQLLDMAAQFYGAGLPIVRLNSRAEMKEWCRGGTVNGVATEARIAITNYEKFNYRLEADQIVNELRHLAGLILDESSRLKSGGGRQKWAIIKSGRGIPYKLSCTATPAPNEIMEFASQAAFLEKMRDANEIIWTYFTRDSKTHRWTVKPHAIKAFFEFMSAWSIYVRDPRRYGWRRDVPVPPPPDFIRHTLAMTDAQRQLVTEINTTLRPRVTRRTAGDDTDMFARQVNATSANRFSQIAKGFLYAKAEGGGRVVRPVDSLKPRYVADLIAGEAADGAGRGLQTLVWTVYDAESEVLAKLLAASPFTVDVMTGRTPKKERAKILDRFRHGESRVLISRASMLGYGMNFQHCGSMVFSGWTFSYEQFYQAIRRAYRHGQTRTLRVHLPVVPELEGQMLEAIDRKDSQQELAIAEMEANYIRATEALRGRAA